jgi:hypothetical protein
LSIADSQMAQSALSYKVYINDEIVSGMKSRHASDHADTFTEPWYRMWWDYLLIGKEAAHAQSATNAEQLGNTACDRYAQAVRPRFRAFDKPLPTCSVMLATDQKIYIVLDFTNIIEALTAANGEDLISVGESLDQTGYDGEVIARSPWFTTKTGDVRAFRTYPLRDLEFAYEEVQSGSRKLIDASVMLTTQYMGNGQTYPDQAQLPGSSEMEGRSAAVVRIVADSGINYLMYTTDGAEWRISDTALKKCSVAVGSGINISLIPGQKPFVSADVSGESKACELDATFVRGW